MSETVKFTCEHVALELAPFAGMDELNECRGKLLQLGWIGVDRNGIGFGNLSARDGATNSFYITGSGTGAFVKLGLTHYAKVIAYDFDRNWLRCEGAVVASSESLTHAAVYETNAAAAAVIHCHNAALWRRLRGVVAATSSHVEYGTPEMAEEVTRLFATTDVKRKKIFVMAGHEGGIVTFGQNLTEAFTVLRAVVALL